MFKKACCALVFASLLAAACNNQSNPESSTPETKANKPANTEQPAATANAGRVVRLSDGDTFTLLLAGNQQLKVRLFGIDAPEKGQDFGMVSRSKMEELTTGHTIRIEEKNKDRYGRTVGIAWRDDGLNLNEEMIRTGMAWHYVAYDKRNQPWSDLEAAAREQKLGLWAQPNPTAPWEWRKTKRDQQQKNKGKKKKSTA